MRHTAVKRFDFSMRMVAVGIVLCAVFAAHLAPVSAQSTIFSVDVWTDRGGEGPGAAGGSYAVGEVTTIWLYISLDSQVSRTLTGPEGSSTSSTFLGAGTYSLELGIAEVTDVGLWTLEVYAMSGSIVATDFVQFEVVTIGTPPPPAPSSPTQPPAPTTPPATAPAAGPLSADNAAALDALIALKMAEGSLPADLDYDVDRNGQVNVDDARLILRWAVQ